MSNTNEQVRSISEKCGYAAAALTVLPIPGSEIIAVMPLHVGMVVKIGQIHGVDVDRDDAQHLIMRIGATVGLSLVGSRMATTAAKIILPGLGGLISAPFMYASTIAIARVADLYFARQGDVSDNDLKSLYKQTVKKARKSFDPSKASSDEAKSEAQAAVAESEQGSPPPPEAVADADPAKRLERLKALLDQGLIEPDEYETAKKRVLDAI